MGRKLALLLAVLIAVLAGAWFAFDRSGEVAESTGANPAGASDRGADIAPIEVHGEARAAEDSAATRAQAAEAPHTAPAAAEVVVFGRVLDSRRFPASGAEVVLSLGDVELARAVSDAKGTFELGLAHRLPQDEGLLVVATRGEGELACDRVSVRGEVPNPKWATWSARLELTPRVEVRALVLRPTSKLEVATTSSGRPIAGAEVKASVGFPWFDLPIARTDARGIATLVRVPAGAVRLTVTTPELEGRATAFAPEQTNVTVELLAPYTTSVTVVDKQTGAPIADAAVSVRESIAILETGNETSLRGGESSTELPERPPVRTNERGLAALERLDSRARYYLAVRVAGFEKYPSSGSSGIRVMPDKELKVELERAPLRTVRWPVIDGDLPAPADSTEMLLRPAPGSRSYRDERVLPDRGRMSGRKLEVEGITGSVSFLVETPDGAIARAWIDTDKAEGDAISFRKPRKIDVLVRDPAGAPAKGVIVTARNQGNNALNDPVQTDADGRATIERLLGGLVEVHVQPVPVGRDTVGGSVDLEQGDGHLEVTLAAETTARITIVIDGAPALPASFTIFGARVVEEFPERGEVAVSFVPSATQQFGVQAQGFITAPFQLPATSDGTEPTARVELQHAATLLVDVAMPPKDRPAINIQVWNGDRHDWTPVMYYFNGLRTPNAPGTSFRFFGLAPGRYRAIDETSRATSDEVDVDLAHEAKIAFDLASIEWITGRVEAANPDDLKNARVLLEPVGAPPLQPTLIDQFSKVGAYPGGDGAFKVLIVRGRKSTLRAWHPWLASNTVDVDGGREGVVLKLTASDEVRVPAPQLAARKYFQAARVFLYASAAEGEPAMRCEAPLVDGALRFGGIRPGRWTIWIDPGGELAPRTLEGVELGAGINTLGAIEFSRGSTLRMKLQVAEGASPPRIYAYAEHVGPPSYDRQINSKGEAVVELAGLGPGKFEVRFDSIMQSRGGTKRSIECDGIHDVELDVDLR